jgi:hypothetical protein
VHRELAGAFGGPQLHHTCVSGDEVTALRWITTEDLETLSVPGWGPLVMGAALGACR